MTKSKEKTRRNNSENSEELTMKTELLNKKPLKLYNPTDYALDGYLILASHDFPEVSLEEYAWDNFNNCKQHAFSLFTKLDQDLMCDDILIAHRMMAYHILSLNKPDKIKELEQRLQSSNRERDMDFYDLESLLNFAFFGLHSELIIHYFSEGLELCKQQTFDLIKTFEERQKQDEWLLPYRMFAHYILNLDKAVEVEALKHLQNTSSKQV